MTDNEIMRGLGKVSYGGHSCMECKYGTTKGDDRCGVKGCKIARDALDLINRQKEEIERLEKALEEQYESSIIAMDVYKSEAIKEFAEKVDEILCLEISPSKRVFWKISEGIKNLVKEMEGSK